MGGEFDGYIEVAVDNGTLYVKPTGEYIFVADDNLDHGDPESNIVFDVPFTVEDFDGDPADANLNLTIVDGAAPTAATVSVDVSDDGSSDQVNLVVERGSDQLDPASFGFDTDAITSAIAALNLTSTGVAVDGSNLSVTNGVLTVFDANNNPVLSVTLGSPTDNNGDLSFPVTVNPLAPLDHLGAGNDASLSLPIFIKGKDSDNDPVSGQVTVNVADTTPTAAGVSNQVTEAEGGAQVSGNLLDNTQFGADGAAATGGVTVVNGVDLSTQTAISGGAFDGYIEVAVDNGTLYVKPTGEYIFVADDNLDHGDPESNIVFDVPFTVEDFDGDPSDANLNLIIVDGAAATAATVSVDVSDDGSSDQVNLVVERGSDQLDPASFGFDTDTISSAIAALNLTSGGVAVDGSNFTLQGSTLTILDGHDNPVLEVILGLPTETNGDLSFPVTVNPLAPLDHLGAGNDASLSLPIFIKGKDSDNDPVSGQVTVNVADTSPTAAGVSNQVTEVEGGAQVAGNLLDNTQFGADGAAAAGGVSVVNGVDLSTQTAISGGAFDGYIEVAVDNGTLYVKPTGEYIFVADDNLDHGAGTVQDPEADIVFDVPFTVEDFDGDPSNANLNLTIVDGAAPTAATVSVDVSDDGSDDQVNLVVERGSDQLDPASFGFDTDAISSAIAALNLTSAGVAVDGSNFTLQGSTLTILDGNDNPVLEVILGLPTETNGDLSFPVTVNPLAPLDHLGSGNNASLSLPIFIKGQDSDNDPVSGQVTVNVADTTPTAAGVSNQVTEAEGGAQVAGNLLDNTQFGADGAAAAGGVTVVNGVDLSTQTAISGGAFDGYIEVDVDNGTLYVKPTGEYIFVADDNLDHGDPESNIVFDVPFTVEDFDGDPSNANLNLTIIDGAAPTAAAVGLSVDEDGNLTDSGSVRFQRGSDQLDLSTIGFDLAATIAALENADLDAISGAVDADATTINGGVMTLFDVNGNALMTISLGLANSDVNGDVTVPISVQLLAGFDHDDSALDLPVVVGIGDSDNDSTTAAVTITVVDGEPNLPALTLATVTEGQIGTEVNVFENADFALDGGRVTSVNGVALDASNFITDISDANFGYHAIDSQYGTVFIKSDGSYRFEADSDIDHGVVELLSEQITISARDGDDDPVTVNLNQGIADGAVPTSAGVDGSVVVAESTGLSQITQQLQFERGSDPITSVKLDAVATASAISQLFGADLPTSKGSALDLNNLSLNPAGTQLVISNELGEPVLQLDISAISSDNDGNWSLILAATSLQGLDHLDVQSIALPIVVTANDQDNDGVSQTTSVVVTDAEPLPQDDSGTMVEGTVGSGNLLTNDNVGTDGASVSAVRIDGSLLTVPQTGVVEIAVSSVPIVIQTRAGELTINPNGSWSLDAPANQSHPNDAPVVIPFEYRLTDGDEDVSGWVDVTLSVTDGAVRPGGETINQSVTEGDLANNSGASTYPKSVSSTVALNDVGSDQLNLSSFGLAIDTTTLALELISELKTDGTGLSSVISGSSITLRNQATGELVLTLDYSISMVNGQPTVQADTTLYAPLDHIKANDSTAGVVSIGGGNIVIQVPLQVQDSDGDPLQNPVTVTTTIKDGSKPGISMVTKPMLNEDLLASQASISADGVVKIKVNSDEIDGSTLMFKGSGHTALTSNGEAIVYSVDPTDSSGRTLLGKVGNQLVLKVELNSTPSAATDSDVSYTVTQYAPIDQDVSKTATFKIKVTDVDGDTKSGGITVDFIDGDNASFSLSGNVHQLTEHNLGDPAQQINSTTAGQLNNLGSITLVTDSDPVSNVYFDFTDEQVLAGVTHAQQPIQLFLVNGTWQAWSMDGANQDTLVFTLESPLALDSNFEVAANTTVQVPYQITWHSFVDQPTDTNSLTINLPVVAEDADGDTTSANVSLTILDGNDPTIDGIDVAAGALAEVNRGSVANTAGTLIINRGSDQAEFSVDTVALQASMDNFTSDGRPLTVALVNGEYHVTRPDGSGGSEIVMVITVADIGSYSVQLRDNLEHIQPGNDSSLSFGLPIILADSDGDSATITPQITIIDSDISASNDLLYSNGSVGEGETVAADAGNGLLSNDQLGADADRANITTVRYQNSEYPLVNGAVTISTDLGSVTVNSDGSWSFTAAAGLDHSSAATLVDSFDYRVLDGDNDSDWATASFSVADDAPVLTAVGGQGLEDAANIPLMVEVNLGDVDQNEVISNLLIDAPAAAAGELYLNGSALAINADNQVQIPVAATVITVSNGQTIVSVAGLTFVPTADYADNSGGALQLGVSVDVSSSVDGSTTLTDTLDISVLAQADQITWLDRDLTIKEDPAGFGERLFMSASNPDGIYAITNDADGSETLSYRIDSIPAGVTLYLNGNPIAVGTELTQAQAERVRVKPDEHDAGQFTIGITAIATEQGSDDQVDLRSRELPADITLNVQPVVDTPTLEFAVAGAGVRNRRIKINEDEFVSFGRYLKFASPDENEVTYLRVEEVATDGSNGVIFYNDQGQWVSLTELQQNGDPLPDGISWDGTGFIIREDVLADVAYRPAEDRSSANFDDVRLQFTAISQEITQDGLAPEPAEFEATSAETLFLNFNIRGVVDAPMLDEVNGFSNERNNQGEPTGRILYDGNEDQALTVNLALMSTDDDGSEVLNYLLRHLPPGFVIADSSGNPPTLAGFEEVEINGQMQTIPIYQISADEMANGTYQITPPSDYAGEVELLIAATITELDGASADYQKPLIWTLKPVVDSVDSNGSASGVEVEVDDVGDYRSGGASIRRGNWLKDIDGSERIEDVAITAPAGFAILYQGQFYQSIGSLQQLTGGDSASVNALLDSGDLILVPATEENGNWTIDADAPPPVSGTNVSLAVTVADQQNGLETIASTPINVTVAVSWRGEVDGDSLFEDGQGDEATGLVGPDQTVVSDGGVLRLGDLIGFVSTDVDGSEQVDSYRIELPQGSQWSLRDSNGTPIGTNIGNGVWLLNQDSLAGVLLQGHDDGDFSIRVVALISDLGDVEARQVDFTVSLSNTVPVNNGGDGGDNGGGDNGDGNNDGDGIVGGVNGELFTDIVTGSEDGRDRDGNPDAASWQGLTDASVYGDDNDSVSFRVDVSDLPSGARLNGNVTEVWDNDGNVVAYIIQEADLDSVSLALANNDSGSFTIPLTVIITDPASGDTYLDDDGNLPTTELTVEIAAVADGVNIALNGEGIETADSDDNERFPLGLSLTPRDGDGSETVTSVLLTPQTGVTLFGDGLQLTADGYQLTRQNGETDAQWQGRIDSIEFYSEPGLTHQLAIGVEVTSVDSNNLGSDQRVQSQPLSVFVAPINNRVDLNANDVSGDEDNPFSIAGISAVLNDADETMSLLLEGVPEGSFLSINGEPLPYNGDGVWQIPVELLNPDGSLPSIDYLPPADTSGEYQLTLRAISSDDEVAEFAEDTLNFMLNINPVADDIALEVASEISGSEGQTVAVDFDLDTSDNFSDAVDQAEAVLLQFSLDPSSDSTLAGGDGKPPAIIVAGTEYPLTLVNGIWQVEVEVAGAVDNQLLQSISFNSGDGFGEGNLNISASAIDRSGSLPQSTGTAVTTSIPLAILPTPDLPQLSAPTSVTGGAAIALAITAAVVNPAVEELSVVISGISSGQLQDGDGNPVGTLQANGDLLLMPTELDGLQWVGASDGDYPLSVSAVSSIGDAAVSSSTTIDVSVDNSADDDAFDAGLMLADDDDEAADSEAAPAPAAEPEPLDLGDILQNPEQQQALDDLLQNAQFAISPEDDDGNVDIVVNLDGDDALILNNVDLDQWQVGADDPDGFLDKFIEEYRQQLQQD
ncbi:beta strand repeat-containing protein [Ferrimonas senticii]|uniref:beta strand repeat-containing protein n=1 Tax=Ferrimonas senticii TaxID=394566 RepID=UPI001969D1F9|nr:VCBS domain-containing protein [Ferrimonas senticii]